MTSAPGTQVSHGSGDLYEDLFVPALFRPWTGRVVAAADLRPGQRVLDVACGTGVLTGAAAERVSPGGEAVGLDCNEGMLATARRKAPALRWELGRAEALPFPDAAFDAVVSQFGLMFFEDRAAGLREMVRVLRPGGTMVVAVWDSPDQGSAERALSAFVEQSCGRETAAAFDSPFSLGDPSALRAVLAEAGMSGATVTTEACPARYPSLQVWLTAEIKGWTFAGALDEEGLTALLRQGSAALRGFAGPDGSVAFETRAHLVRHQKTA